MQTLWSKLKLGFIALVPILVIVAVLASVVNWVTNIGYSFVENRSINIGINLVILFVALPLSCGFMLSMRWFRNLGINLLGRLPLIGPLFSFILNHDYVERIQGGDIQEVFFKYIEENWTIGIVVNELQLPEDPNIYSGPLVPWLVILAPPTAPLALTAHLILRRKNTVKFTGRTYKDTLLTVAAFGSNLNLSKLVAEWKAEKSKRPGI